MTLKTYFRNEEALKEADGGQYLARLAGSAVTVINDEHYGRAVHDLYLRRQLIFLAKDVRDTAYDAPLEQPPREQVESVEASLEMSAEPLGKHSRSIRIGIVHHLLQTGKVEHPAFDSLFKTARGLEDIPMVLDDTGGQTPDYIERSARRLMRQNRLDLLIVDLLQLMRSLRNCGPRTGSSRSATSATAGVWLRNAATAWCLASMSRRCAASR